MMRIVAATCPRDVSQRLVPAMCRSDLLPSVSRPSRVGAHLIKSRDKKRQNLYEISIIFMPNLSRLLPHSGACLQAKTLILISVLLQYQKWILKADVSIVSPSSERIKELWATCSFYNRVEATLLVVTWQREK